MARVISELSEPGLFRSRHWMHSHMSNNKELINIKGIVLINEKGAGSNWDRSTVKLLIKFPSNIIPNGKKFRVEQWAPFVTINAIYNKNKAINAGWAVDDFWGPGSVTIENSFSIHLNIAVRDIDGWLYRAAYDVTLSGRFVD